MKILIKGIGSIGKRHLSNLFNLGYREVVLVSSKHEMEDPFSNLSIYRHVNEACRDHHFTHGFICSPTSSHLADLQEFIRAGIPRVYLEKPVSHQADGFQFVDPYLETGGQIVVGYDLHFDPGLGKVRDLLLAGAIGKVVSANAFVGQYLPDWRPGEDHRKGMSASRARGGGVMLDLVHEFDYLCWLLGTPRKVAAFYHHNASLEIETEDVANVLIEFNSGVSATIHLDYHQRQLIRHCIITGTSGTITWDLALRTVTYCDASKKNKEFNFNSFDRNDRFIEIVKAFMNNHDDKRLCSFKQGLTSLQMVLAAKESCERSVIVNLS